MKCVECGVVGNGFHMHHISYKKNKTIILCPSCHRKVHNDKNHRFYPVDKRPIKIPKYVLRDLKNKIKSELEDQFLNRERNLLYLKNELELEKKDFEEHKSHIKKVLYDRKKHLDFRENVIKNFHCDGYSRDDKIEIRKMADKIISLEHKIEVMGGKSV